MADDQTIADPSPSQSPSAEPSPSASPSASVSASASNDDLEYYEPDIGRQMLRNSGADL